MAVTKTRTRWRWLALLAVLVLVAAACGDSGTTTTQATEETPTEETPTETPAEEFVFGMILVGPQNDRGWSQAHREGGEYVIEQLGNARMLLVDLVNSADKPESPPDQVAADMIDQGAQLVFFTSDDMKDGAQAAAVQFPELPMVWSSGDSAWADGKAYEAGLTNLANSMGQMEFGKMIAGCAAALTTQNGSIGYVGPLINDETRRLVNSAYLGAKHCWENVRGETAPIGFEVNWIGFWFNIPGVTLDPTQVSNDFLDGGADVLISGIDTTEALVRTGQRADAGETVWAIPYDFEDACAEAPGICLGVPYFNWGPSYLEIAQSVMDDSFSNTWDWNGPDWSDLNNRDTSAIGWVNGDGLSSDGAAQLEEFIADLGDGSLNLYTGPLNWQDGSEFLADGATASDQEIWYAERLLEGIVGASSA